MQKKLIAAAVAGLLAVPALAQTNVTISGRFVGGYESYKLKDCQAAVDCRAESKFSDQNSRIIFNVVEDLGGGLKAWGQLDSRFNTDVGGDQAAGALNWWAQGNTGMGLMHDKFGKVTLGHWDVYYTELENLGTSPRAQSLQYNLGLGLMSQAFNPMAGATASWAAVTAGVGTRTSNLLMWDSPNWNGFTGRLGYSTNPTPQIGAFANEGTGVTPATHTGNAGGGYAWTAALRYSNGPWTAGYAHWDSKAEDRRKNSGGSYVSALNINDVRGDRIWAGYKFAMGLNIGFGYDWTRNDAAVGTGGLGGSATLVNGTSTTRFKRTAWYIPVSYSFGPHAVYASYARANDATNTTGFDSGASAWNIGYDYAFSKRTTMGIYYTSLSNKGNSAGGGNYNLFSTLGNGGTTLSGHATGSGFGSDARQWYIGMAHNF